MAYILQLLPNEEQTNVLIKALKEFSLDAESETEAEVADELTLELLKKKREWRNREARSGK